MYDDNLLFSFQICLPYSRLSDQLAVSGSVLGPIFMRIMANNSKGVLYIYFTVAFHSFQRKKFNKNEQGI